MIEIVENHLKFTQVSFEYKIHPLGNPHAFYFDQKFDHGFMRGVIGVHYEDKRVFINRIFPTSLPKEKETELSEFATLINSQNHLGTYDLDVEDMIFGITAILPFGSDEEQFKESLQTYFNALTGGLNTYFKGALEIGLHGKDPFDVFNRIEIQKKHRLN